MKKFKSLLILFSILSVTAVSFGNTSDEIRIQNLNHKQEIQNNQQFEFQIHNDSDNAKLVQFELSNQNFILKTPYQIQIPGKSDQTVRIQNLKAFAETKFSIKTEQTQNIYTLLSKDQTIEFNKNFLNFQDLDHNKQKAIGFEITNKSKEKLALELKLTSDTFQIQNRANFMIAANAKLNTNIQANCRQLGKITNQLEIYKGTQLIHSIPLEVNCKPNYSQTSYISNPPQEIDLGFVSSKSQKIQNYSLINLGEKNIELKQISKLQYFNFKYQNQKIIIELLPQTKNCTNCLIQETLILKTNDQYKPFILIPIKAYIYAENIPEFELEYNLINPCVDNPKIHLKANQAFNFDLYKNQKLEIQSNLYQSQYILNLPCDDKANYQLKYYAPKISKSVQLHTQNYAVISFSKNNLDQNNLEDKIFITVKKDYNLPLKLELIQDHKILYQKEITDKKFILSSKEIQELKEGQYQLDIYNKQVKISKDLHIQKKN